MVKMKLKNVLLCMLSGIAFFTVILPEEKKHKKRSITGLSSQLVDFKYDQEDLKSILSFVVPYEKIIVYYTSPSWTVNPISYFKAGKSLSASPLCLA